MDTGSCLLLGKGRCQKKRFFGTLSQTSDPTHPPRTFETPLSEKWKLGLFCFLGCLGHFGFFLKSERFLRQNSIYLFGTLNLLNSMNISNCKKGDVLFEFVNCSKISCFLVCVCFFSCFGFHNYLCSKKCLCFLPDFLP